MMSCMIRSRIHVPAEIRSSSSQHALRLERDSTQAFFCSHHGRFERQRTLYCLPVITDCLPSYTGCFCGFKNGYRACVESWKRQQIFDLVCSTVDLVNSASLYNIAGFSFVWCCVLCLRRNIRRLDTPSIFKVSSLV